ncbi:carboxypeptidase-like regulatory domain-containing protein [Singulisphaera sp. Ch08]|uniref:Carboxypeptidase-like regulatory domain-containing protein n=1 Tax=Singulisphaera sp. Ch08 TaxID=3120278 RepID=A0AAU7CIW7_9BACT
MRHSSCCFAKPRTLLAVCLATSTVMIVSAHASAPSSMGTLSGKVVDPDGKPVAGARIWVDTHDRKKDSIKKLVEARTDAEGRFRLGPIEPVYRLHLASPPRIETDGFVGPRITSGTLTIFPDRDLDLGTIQVDRGRIFTGQVLDVDGKPRPGAEVTVGSMCHSQGHASGGSLASARLTTDAEGRFHTPPLPVGHLILGVGFPDRQSTNRSGRGIPPGGAEDLGTIRLEPDVPVVIVAKDEDGRPISGVEISHPLATTDAEGKATLRGFGANFQFQLQARKAGYTFIKWGVRKTEQGIYWHEVGRKGPESGPFNELLVILKRAGWIEGQAVDADTGEPVRLERVVVCNFERKPSGEVVLRGCRSDFEQTEPGRFRASFPGPNEYHLTFSAAGYHDAEAYTPRVTELTTIGGIVARMKKKTEGSAPQVAKQTITGMVTRNGKSVRSGWAALWALRRSANAPNSPVMRQRTAVSEPVVYASSPIRDGSFQLDVPFQSEAWYVVAEEPGYPLTQVGPIPVALNQKKLLDITCTEGARISGRVTGVPPGWEGHLWIVAFSKTAVREETRAARDGTFSLPPLPPGEYGLKVGHDAYDDAEVYPGSLVRDHPESFKETADPWKRAKRVRIEAGRDVTGVEVEMPQ